MMLWLIEFTSIAPLSVHVGTFCILNTLKFLLLYQSQQRTKGISILLKALAVVMPWLRRVTVILRPVSHPVFLLTPIPATPRRYM